MKTEAPPKTGSRQSTLDPIRKFQIPMELHEVESTIPCGFRMAWMGGKTESGKKFNLSSGAGCGSPYMMFDFDGRDFYVDMRVVIKQIVEAITA